RGARQPTFASGPATPSISPVAECPVRRPADDHGDRPRPHTERVPTCAVWLVQCGAVSGIRPIAANISRRVSRWGHGWPEASPERRGLVVGAGAPRLSCTPGFL